MQMDWKDNTPSKPKILPTGSYVVRVKSWKYGETKSKNQQVIWTYVVISEQQKGEVVLDYHVLVEQNLWKLGSMVYACGIDTSKLQSMEIQTPAFNRVLDFCKGCEIGIYLEQTTYQGKEKNSITDYIRRKEEMIDPRDGIVDEDLPEFLTEE